MAARIFDWQRKSTDPKTADLVVNADLLEARKGTGFNEGAFQGAVSSFTKSGDASGLPDFYKDFLRKTGKLDGREAQEPTLVESVKPPTGGGLIGESLNNIRSMAAGDFTPTPQMTSAGQAAGLLKEGSPLIDYSVRKAQNLAAERGLQNTALAGTGGVKAAFESVTPFALQDAAFLQNRALTGAAGLVESGLSSQDFRELQIITQLQGDISQDIQSQTDAAALVRTLEQAGSAEQIALAANLSREGVSAKEIASRMELGREEITSIEARSTAELASREAISDAGIAAQVEDTAARLAGDAKNNFNSALSNLHNEFIAQNTAIARDPNLTPEARVQAQADLQNLYETGAASLASIWSDDEVVWSPTVPEPTPEPPPVEPGETEAPVFNQANYNDWFQANQNTDWLKNLQSQGALLPVNFYNWSQENTNEEWFKEMSDQQRVEFFNTNIRPSLPPLLNA